MSLTHCTDCDLEISALAYTCPKCGRPARQLRSETAPRHWIEKDTLQYGATALALIVIILTVIAVSWKPGIDTSDAMLVMVSIGVSSIPFLATAVAVLIVVSTAMKTDS